MSEQQEQLQEALLHVIAHENPAQTLQYIDAQIDQFNRLGSMFKLNWEDRWMKPVLEEYALDLKAWREFVRVVRDQLEFSSARYREVQEFYERLGTRWFQRRTRAVLAAAVASAIKLKIIEDNPNAKMVFQKRCMNEWKRLKKALLDDARRKSPKGRLNLDHREELLDAFWTQLEADANQGKGLNIK